MTIFGLVFMVCAHNLVERLVEYWTSESKTKYPKIHTMQPLKIRDSTWKQLEIMPNVFSTSRYLPTVDCWFSRKYHIYIFGHKEKLLNSPLLDTLVHCKTRSIITQQTIGNQTKSWKSDYWKIDTKKSNISFLSLLENWYFLDFLNIRPHIIWYLNDLQVPACQFRFLENADIYYIS